MALNLLFYPNGIRMCIFGTAFAYSVRYNTLYMRKKLLAVIFLLSALQAGAFGSRYSSSYEPGAYICGGLGSMMAGKDPLGGAELMVAGNLAKGRLLGGANVGLFRGASQDSYNYTIPNAKYNYRAYSLGFNLGVRVTQSDNFDMTVNCLFGEEILGFGYRDTTAKNTRYNSLLNNDLWFVRPAVSFTNRRNFELTASYNFLFTDELFAPVKPQFGDNASDFNGPVVSMIWITDHKYHHYNHHCRRGWY